MLIVPVDKDLGVWVALHKSEDRIEEGGLACPRSSDDAHLHSRLDAEADFSQNGRKGARVPHSHIPELKTPFLFAMARKLKTIPAGWLCLESSVLLDSLSTRH